MVYEYWDDDKCTYKDYMVVDKYIPGIVDGIYHTDCWWKYINESLISRSRNHISD